MFKNFTPKRLVAVTLLAGGFAIAAPVVANADEQPAEISAESVRVSIHTDLVATGAVWEWDEWE